MGGVLEFGAVLVEVGDEDLSGADGSSLPGEPDGSVGVAGGGGSGDGFEVGGGG